MEGERLRIPQLVASDKMPAPSQDPMRKQITTTTPYTCSNLGSGSEHTEYKSRWKRVTTIKSVEQLNPTNVALMNFGSGRRFLPSVPCLKIPALAERTRTVDTCELSATLCGYLEHDACEHQIAGEQSCELLALLHSFVVNRMCRSCSSKSHGMALHRLARPSDCLSLEV